MMHYYHYIEAGRCLDETTRFYRVAVGHGRQADRDFLFLLAHAAEHGHYFELRSSQSIDFVTRCIESLSYVTPAPMELGVTARELVRALRSGTAIPLPSHVLRNRHHLMYYLDGNYRSKR